MGVPKQQAKARALATELRAMAEERALSLSAAFPGRPLNLGLMRDRKADAIAELAELIATLDFGKMT